MAGLTKAQRAERAAAAQAVPLPPIAPVSGDPGLVLMEKDGESLRVHPSCVKAHRLVGWKEKESAA